MNFNFDWVDVAVVVVLVAAVASRFLKFKLPRDTRPKAERKGWREVAERFQPKTVQQKAQDEAVRPDVTNQKALNLRAKGRLLVPTGLTGMAALKAVDPTFTEAAFIKGAKDAYLFFHEKWAAGDEDELAKLAAPRLLDGLSDHDYGKPAGKVSEIKSAIITSARLSGRTAVVELDFEALHGGKKKLKSHWVLARAVGGNDPNWELQSFKPY